MRVYDNAVKQFRQFAVKARKGQSHLQVTAEGEVRKIEGVTGARARWATAWKKVIRRTAKENSIRS